MCHQLWTISVHWWMDQVCFIECLKKQIAWSEHADWHGSMILIWGHHSATVHLHGSLTWRTSAFQGGGDRKQQSCLNKTWYHPVQHHWQRYWRTNSEIEFHVSMTQVQAGVPNLFRARLENLQNVCCHCPTLQTIQRPNNRFEDHFSLGIWLNRHWSIWLIYLDVPHMALTRHI